MSWKNTSITVCALAAMSCATPTSNALAQPMRGAAGGYEVEVLVNGAPTPTFFHNGETYALGRMGERYTLRVWNRSSRRIEAVVSVDGRDVIDGKPGDFRGKRGYLVPAWGSVDIDGWRLSERQAAAFRFTTVSDSYAGRTGSARNVGVIGVAVFPERVYVPRPRPRPIYPDYEGYGGGWDPPRERLGRGDDSYGPQANAEPAPASPPAGAGSGMRDKSAEEAPRSSASADGALAEKRASPRRERPGLGTQFGEEVYSHVREVSFTRANPSTPSVFLGVRYNDREGLIAMGIDVDGRFYGYDEPDLRRTAEPFPVSERRYSTPPRGWQRY